jgi:hypothetical protein
MPEMAALLKDRLQATESAAVYFQGFEVPRRAW